MSEILEQKMSRQDMREILAKQHSCFVLITCGSPNSEGKMEVEMMYEGDASLAAYLIESAQNFIEEEESTE